MNKLEINNLSKTYANGKVALQHISLSLHNGMYGLLGPNGSGKSTLMKTLAGLQLPDGGEILFNGNDILKWPEQIKRHLGYLPQEFGVYPSLSAYELMNHLAVLKGITDKWERKEQILTLLEKTNLSAYRNKEVHTFSGGMKQRFGIAQALLGSPKILIVDEPTAGLDPEERNRFNNLLSEVGEDKIVILSTHIVEDVRNLCPQFGILVQGRLIKSGSTDEMLEATAHIWSKTIDKSEFEDYAAKYTLLHSSLKSGRQQIHILHSTDPGNGFVRKTAELEDVYFSELHAQKMHSL